MVHRCARVRRRSGILHLASFARRTSVHRRTPRAVAPLYFSVYVDAFAAPPRRRMHGRPDYSVPELVRSEIASVDGVMQVVLALSKGCACHVKKMCKVRVSSTAESLCDVAERRRGCVANLAVEPEVVLDLRLLGELVHGDLQRSCELPAHQFPKMTRAGHPRDSADSLPSRIAPNISQVAPKCAKYSHSHPHRHHCFRHPAPRTLALSHRRTLALRTKMG